MKPTTQQQDLFNDLNEASVFTCIAGAFIGKFTPDTDDPVMRLSAYFETQAAAEAALASGHWPEALPEDCVDEEETHESERASLQECFHQALVVFDAQDGYRPASADEVLDAAVKQLNRRFAQGQALTSPEDTRRFLQLKLSHLEHEVFAVLWLDNRHRVLAFETLFRGTIDGASVHPREVVKSALQHNAAACILAHNHPSGIAEPSQADQRITQRLQEALGLIEVRTLDHIVVAENTCSFAEQGLL